MVSVYCFCVRNMNVGTIPPQPQPQTWVYRAPLGRFGEQWVINGLTVMIPPLALIWSYLILFDLICTCWFWFRLPPLALFDSRTTYCKGICSPTRSSNPCKLSNRCLGAIAATWGTDELSKSSLRVARVDDGVADNTDTHTHLMTKLVQLCVTYQLLSNFSNFFWASFELLKHGMAEMVQGQRSIARSDA